MTRKDLYMIDYQIFTLFLNVYIAKTIIHSVSVSDFVNWRIKERPSF